MCAWTAWGVGSRGGAWASLFGLVSWQVGVVVWEGAGTGPPCARFLVMLLLTPACAPTVDDLGAQPAVSVQGAPGDGHLLVSWPHAE